MERITQSSAATAEESARVSEELNSQAQSLTDTVGQLQALIGGVAKPATTTSRVARKVGPQREMSLTFEQLPHDGLGRAAADGRAVQSRAAESTHTLQA